MKIVILGTGFAAFRFIKKINKRIYDIVVVSPRNHFLFTPLLPSTTVGTLEFRSIIEPIRNTENITFHQSSCTSVNSENNSIECKDADTGKVYTLGYDYLVIAVGEVTNTFGISGIYENALFLKELSDARKIRTKVIDCFENASLPGISPEEKKDFLRFAVCGGGPTGVEFAAELNDFIEEDVKRKYHDLAAYVEIILIEARGSILATFDKKLSEYAMKIFKRQNIILKTNSLVTEVTDKTIMLNDGTMFNYGLLVWATGNTSTDFVRNSGFAADKRKKIITDDFFYVKNGETFYNNIFAIGDCAAIEGKELPATAQVAQQTGLFLAKFFNKRLLKERPFHFKNLGMLAYIGNRKALADTPQYKGTGFGTFVFWRSAYLTKLVSFKNKALVLFDWIKTFISGRDVSNF
ncbi:MAG: FAD-dependent oxidoreductase [Ignavibacteria bacterium]|nr:FAD-dependent oxidoreductase [Ignavibacteria bacterium]